MLAACLALSSLLWGVGAVRPGRDEALHTGISRQWPILSEYEHRSMAGEASSYGLVIPAEGRTTGSLALVFKTHPFERIPELVKTKGYPLEEHFVTTSDGYVLGTYRIPHGREGASPGPTPRRPVLLQHGLLDSSATWVLNDPDQSLALILADAGWDVWLGNSRGNAYSRNHTGLGPDTAAFWDFSFDDMAAADLPALTAHVQGVTGCATLAYVGHSQGTTVALAALSTQGALRAALRPVVLLAPAISLRHIQSIPMLTLARLQADQVIVRGGGTLCDGKDHLSANCHFSACDPGALPAQASFPLCTDSHRQCPLPTPLHSSLPCWACLSSCPAGRPPPRCSRSCARQPPRPACRC